MPEGASASPAGILAPMDTEYRVQAVEDQQAVILEELEALKGLGGQLLAWKGQMDAAGPHVAAVLGTWQMKSGPASGRHFCACVCVNCLSNCNTLP